MNRWLIILLLVMTAGTAFGGNAGTPEAGTPSPALSPAPAIPHDPPLGIFIPEHRYHYRFGWQGIPAFDGTIQATRHDGVRPWYHFELEGKTRRWLNFIYKMHDKVDAYVDGVDYLPHLLFARLRAPRDNTDLVVKFDHRRRVAHARWTKNGKTKKREIPFQRANDPVTAIYLLESLHKPGDKISFEVVNGKRLYRVGLRVTGRERVKVKAGSFDTLKIEPTLTRPDKPHYQPKFKRMTVWVTAGATRIPVKLTSKVFIGSVSGELVKVTPRPRTGA
jgi:hypothetical protein